MAHEHCDKCFITNCFNSSSCPLIYCPNGCSARMHECKRNDHEYICSNIFIPCLNANYGCPSKIRRSDLTRHLRICPASIIVCSFRYNHEFHFDKFDNSTDKNLIQTIARRDNIWSEHINEFQKNQTLFLELNNNKKKKKENLIQSTKYRYITMAECMLSKKDGVICSACRINLRQLEENEDQRLSELIEEERKIMENFDLNSDNTSDQMTMPSLVQMSSTLIHSTDMTLPTSISSLSDSNSDLLKTEPMSMILDSALPYSYTYRLNYFASNEHPKTFQIFDKTPDFYCHALCRRDEIEQHWHIHFNIDCILNTEFIQQCPKSQYGCTFQYERIEPCQKTDQPIRVRFDERNDAIAFEWYPDIIEKPNEQSYLLDLPSELIEKILFQLDSLSLRNISLVCHRLRTLCQHILPSRGIVTTEYERNLLSHGDVTWIERKKHWLFTNTSSYIPKWKLKNPNKLTSLSQHLLTCSYGETKDLQNEPPFPLLAWALPDWAKNKTELNPPE